MEQKDVTRRELCNALGFSYSTLADWIHARKYPRIDKIEMMENYFGVNKADLVEIPVSISFDLNCKVIPSGKNIMPFNPHRVPLVGRIAAGTPILAEQNIEGYENLADGVQADFCLQVHGDSMIGANIHSNILNFSHKKNKPPNA